MRLPNCPSCGTTQNLVIKKVDHSIKNTSIRYVCKKDGYTNTVNVSAENPNTR